MILCASAVGAANFEGVITAFGYSPPTGVWIVWRQPGAPDITKQLNDSYLWDGSNAGDETSYFCRYAECDSSVLGRYITVFGSHQWGGETSAIMTELFREIGLIRNPNQREIIDFAAANFRDHIATCADAVLILGHTTCEEIPPPPPPAPYCGNGSCNVGESCESCQPDCGLCPIPPDEDCCEAPLACLPVLEPSPICPQMTGRIRETIDILPAWGAIWGAARKERVRELNSWASNYKAVEQSTGCLTVKIR